jgi:2-polyprenyl-3-methyl-5-hydroxy-6-metoxy-1,4-benzoquinol methylase
MPDGRVLELGVGDQVWTPKLLRRFPSVDTVDGSQVLLNAMGESLANAGIRERWTPHVALFEEFRPAERYDTVVATYILEHVAAPALILRLCNERWLRPGGLVVAAVPHAMSLHRRLAVKMGLTGHAGELGETDRRMEHMHCFSYPEMERIIVEAGLRVEERGGMFCKPLPNADLASLTEAQLQGLFLLGIELPIEYSAAIYFFARSAPDTNV